MRWVVEEVVREHGFFFFSSRRRHTRYWRDWSSDVCSSDLTGPAIADAPINDLVALCNSPTEIGVAGVFIPPSARTLEWCQARSDAKFEPVYSEIGRASCRERV